jgi:uncharacterized protein
MLLTLDSIETRVLACLVEKDLATPEYYPMTLNALTTACNQKSNRDPVTSFTEDQVDEALTSLQRQRLAGTQSGAGMRATKYRHTLKEALDLSSAQLAILAELMLRGPQTVGELRSRASRMSSFDSLEAVEQMLSELAGREDPLVLQLPRLSGQKEARYTHLLSGKPDLEALVASAAPPDSASNDRIIHLEEEVADLRNRLQQLEDQFSTFRRQFE